MFLKLNTDERWQEVKSKRVCFNCLRGNHPTFKCRVIKKCSKCNRKHHDILHKEEIKENVSEALPPSSPQPSVSSNHSTQETKMYHVLLSTALVHVEDSSGNMHICRNLLDSGSQSNFITASTVKRLRLSEDDVNYPIVGIGQSKSTIRRITTIRMKSRTNEFNATLQCLIMDKITENLPTMTLDKAHLDIPKNLTLADPEFNATDKVDMLIGAGLFWELTCIGHIKQISGLVLQKTKLGWIAAGNISLPTTLQSKINLHTASIEKGLQRLWELEECQE